MDAIIVIKDTTFSPSKDLQAKLEKIYGDNFIGEINNGNLGNIFEITTLEVLKEKLAVALVTEAPDLPLRRKYIDNCLKDARAAKVLTLLYYAKSSPAIAMICLAHANERFVI